MQVSGRNHLTTSTKELIRAWRQTRLAWRDSKAEEFERDFLKELEPSVSRAVHSIESLERLLAKLKKDCE